MKGSSVSQRKGFLFGLPVGAVLGALIALAISGAFGGSDTPLAEPGDPNTTTTSVASVDDVPQVVTQPGDGFVDPPVGRSAIPNRAEAATIQSRSSGIYASNGIRLTGSRGAVAFAVNGLLVYQLPGVDTPVFVDRGAGADILANPANVQIRLLSLGFKDGTPFAVVKLLEQAVVEGVETTNERLATINVSNGEITDYGIVAGFESTLASASFSPTGFVLGIFGEGEAFLQTLGFDGKQGEIIVPCFTGSCPRRPWVSTDGETVAYLSGLSNLVIYDLDSDRVFTDIDLGIPLTAGNDFPGWAITDFDDVTVAVAEITFDADGNLTYGNAFLVTIGGEVTEYGTQGAVTFIR